ncbi:hypothetical protein OSB04_014192 [Centaurea solstitialis]|uniref:PGG domain-containing protein n=1 Tax=Centaurea solstitialis TaxID=347529 RepID=A0AA38W673_9ASTR|nr:hypothetical protein OSB04_014192 [Centaurea solstitialis]
MMTHSESELQNAKGETALFVAAEAGHVQMAKILISKNQNLSTITDSKGKMSISVAALYGKCEMVKYLYSCSSMTDDLWTYENRDCLLMECIEADLFDIALDIVQKFPQHATSGNALQILARKPEAFKRKRTSFEMFASSLANNILAWQSITSLPNISIRQLEYVSNQQGYMYLLANILNHLLESEILAATHTIAALQLLRTIWQSILKLDKKRIDDIIRGPRDSYPTQNVEEVPTPGDRTTHYPSQIKGNKTFVFELIRKYPDLIRNVNDKRQSIFHVAVLHRQKGIFGLLDDIGSIKNSVITLEDVEGNNMLHLTGKRVVDEREKDDKRNDNVTGSAIRMQEELLWFKGVKAILPPSYQEKRNRDGLTPGELFTRGHSHLLAASEGWLKGLASELMVVAALIAAIAFAAPFAVPGGWDQNTGSPIFMHKRLFMLFILLDASSFLLSSISILSLISILTSRYTERDFLENLPKKMVVSLATLMYALVNVMLTFLTALFIFIDNKSIGIFVGVFALFVTPFITSLQDPFFQGMRRSMNFQRSFFSDE